MFLQFPRRHHQSSKGTRLAFSAMFLALGAGMVDTVLSIYLDSFVNNTSIVGALAGVLALAATIFYLISPPLLKRFAETRIWTRALFVSMVGYLLYYLITNIWLFMIVAISMTFFTVLRMQAHGILVRDLYKKKEIASGEGLQYTLLNVGFMLGPLIAGFVAANLGVRTIFLFVIVMMLIAYLMFKVIKIKDINRFTKDTHIIRNLKEFSKKKRLLRAYLLRGGLTVYWGLIYIFMPLFIIQSGLKEYWIGIFLFGIAVPLVFLEYFVGKKADKVKLRKFFIMGYGILALASLACFIFAQVYYWMIILVLASVGAAFLEPNSEALFFRIVKRNEEEKFYGPFSTSTFLMGSISKFLAAGVLAFLPNQFLFLLMFILLTGLFAVSFKVRD